MKKETQKKNFPQRKRKIFSGIAWFIFIYMLLFYYGARSILLISAAHEMHKKVWVAYVIVGLIMLASSLITKMLIGWQQGLRKLSNKDSKT